MDSSNASWSDWLQGVAETVVNTGAAVYVAKNTPPQSINQDGWGYVDGQPKVSAPASVGGLSPMVLLVGAGLLLAVFLLKD